MHSAALFSDAFVTAPIFTYFKELNEKHCSSNGHEYQSMAESIWFCSWMFWMDKLSEVKGNFRMLMYQIKTLLTSWMKISWNAQLSKNSLAFRLAFELSNMSILCLLHANWNSTSWMHLCQIDLSLSSNKEFQGVSVFLP